MQRETVIDRHGGTELQLTGQVPQVSHAFVAHTTLAVVFIFV